MQASPSVNAMPAGAPPRAAANAAAASFAALTDSLDYLDNASIEQVRQAYRFADEAHLGQLRKNGEPYITHPIAVAAQCATWKLDAQALMAALLHDAMEDCGVTKMDLIERFGAPVAELVDGLTKLDKLEFDTREENQAESFRKMLLAMARDVRVILIKLADRSHNMRTLSDMPRSKWRRISSETLEIYAPIAHRLGLNQTYRELQDLSFRHLHPWRYATLAKAVGKARNRRRDLVQKVQTDVDAAFSRLGMPVRLAGREKTLYAIYQKMVLKHLSFAQVTDIYGFRVIVPSVTDCYTALGVLHQMYKPVPGKFKDHIAIPKLNGYQSLHTTLVGPSGVNVEFQMRTEEMHLVAEAGVAAHWLYKAEKETFSDLQKRTHQWLQSLLDIQSQTGDSLEFIEHVKVDLFPDAVYVFTPRGQIRALPRGATIIDFAYSVHTDIGDTAVSAKVNQLTVPLRTELQNGDVVEVITDASSRPNPAWLAFVRTGKARAEIRHVLRTLNLAESVDLGKRLLEQSLASLRIDAGAMDPATLERGARDAGARSLDELYADIGLGKRLAQVVARTIALQFSTKTAAAALIMPRLAPIFVHGSEGSAVQYSNCCHPLPGDQIVGHLRGGHGLALHRHDCDTAIRQRIKDAERWIDVQWAEDVTGLYLCGIEVLVSDDRGVLGKVAAEISSAEANIVNVAMDAQSDKTATLRFSVQVRDRVHLAQVMRNLRRLSEAKRISRV